MARRRSCAVAATSLRKRAHRAGELDLFRDDVVGVAAMEFGDRDDHRIDRIDRARGDGLQRADQLAADHDRVDRAIRHRRMAAFAVDRDGELGGRRHDRSGPRRELADRQARNVVQAEHFFDAEALHHAVLDHLVAAAAAFFGRLEDDRDRAGEIACLGEILRRAEQHGGVAVMAAGVHDARASSRRRGARSPR